MFRRRLSSSAAAREEASREAEDGDAAVAGGLLVDAGDEEVGYGRLAGTTGVGGEYWVGLAVLGC